MASRNIAARRDAIVIVAISFATALVGIRFDLSETLMGWARQHEKLQVDELPAVLLVVATCLIWFSSRRYFEARRQLTLRTDIEMKLAEALAENQRLAQQYVDMQESERKALARDLHDELGQYLNVIKLDAVSIRDARGPEDALVNGAALAVIENVDRVYGVVAGLIRQLRPAGFDELGVTAALEHCLNEWRARLPGTRITVSIDTDLGALDELRALALFRLVQEAMNNVARHSRATRVEVRIGRRTDSMAQEFVDVSIVDNGRGLDLTSPRSGLGLVGMRERAAACGGLLTLSSRPGAGLTVSASLPVSTAVARP